MKTILSFAAFLAALSVALGAYFAHALPPEIPEATRISLNSAVQYHMLHSVGILIAGLFHESYGMRQVRYTVYLFLAGIILFSGGIYMKYLTGISFFTGPTPLGGIAFILGWLNFSYTLMKR